MQAATGSTTILFTDIEGSSRLWEADPARMSRALAGHDALARAAVERHRGHLVKTLGDGVHAVFEDPLDAVNAVLTLQQALLDPATTHGVPIRIRCGLHTGPVERRDNDYFGVPVNRTARIMSVAHGGQVLLSEALVETLGARLPPELTLRDLGRVRLKDLSEPEHVYQLAHPRLRSDFPALRSLESTPNNLPQQLSSFVGREHEMAEARALLGRTRLLTLLGMGGLGKTRLALHVAADELDHFPDGVWFVDLAPIRDASLVPSVLAQALGVQEEPGRPLAQTLGRHLRALATLVILDNCEHLVAACADLANQLLRETTKLRILATSREALRIPGEQTYAVRPLASPSRSAGVEDLAKCDAVQLFVDRARLHRPSFVLTAAEAPAIAELCSRLEGIPLAIELAAARMRSLSVGDINARLRDRFKLLTGGGRVLLERQQTLRALVDWSYDLLAANERVLFDRMSVFADGFDLAACEQVCGSEPLDADAVLGLLESLVDKSLVLAEPGSGRSRYRTLETIREYARERLLARGEAHSIAQCHCDHFFAFAKQARDGMRGAQIAEWTQRLEADLDNLRAAIAFTLSGDGDPIVSVKFEVALVTFWGLRGYATEGRNYVRQSLALPAVVASPVAHAHALYVGAVLAGEQSDHAAAERMLVACLDLRRSFFNPVDVAATLSTLSLTRLRAGDAESARANEEEALAIFRELGDRIGEAIGLLHLGQVYAYLGDAGKAGEQFERSFSIAREIDHREILCECERRLGEVALERGDVERAREHLSNSLDRCKASGDKRDEAMALWISGRADLLAGERDRAAARLAAALECLHRFEMTAELLGCLEDVAVLVRDIGDPCDAARLCAVACSHRERLKLRRAPREERRFAELASSLRTATGDDAFAACMREAADWTLEESVSRAQTAMQAGVAV